MKKDATTNSFINPEPHVIVSCRDKDGRDNALSIGFIANVSFNPRIIMIAILHTRYSHHIIKESGEFVVNIATEELKSEVEYLGSTSGRDIDKLENISTTDATLINAPLIDMCPVNFECRVVECLKPGTHDVFFGEVLKVHCDEKYLNNNKSINWDKINILHS